MLKDNLKAARLQAGMTLDEVAQKVGVSRQTIQRYESGVIQNIPSDNIEKIASILDVSPGVLMGWESPDHTAGIFDRTRLLLLFVGTLAAANSWKKSLRTTNSPTTVSCLATMIVKN